LNFLVFPWKFPTRMYICVVYIYVPFLLILLVAWIIVFNHD
jgi:hypothetical protein